MQMGVLIPGNDLTAVRRTARFFLNNFEERLKAQKVPPPPPPGPPAGSQLNPVQAAV